MFGFSNQSEWKISTPHVVQKRKRIEAVVFDNSPMLNLSSCMPTPKKRKTVPDHEPGADAARKIHSSIIGDMCSKHEDKESLLPIRERQWNAVCNYREAKARVEALGGRLSKEDTTKIARSFGVGSYDTMTCLSHCVDECGSLSHKN